MLSQTLRRLALLLLLCSSLSLRSPAQSPEGTMSEGEIDQLRDAAYIPADRIAVFIKLLDLRASNLQALVAKPRRPGREEDLHEILQQFASIIDELNDNLDDYGPRHRALRKQLPKLLEATDRWATAIRTPADSDVYKISRALALEGVQDARDETKKLIEEQKVWFAAHPPSKETDPPTLEDRR